MLIAIWMLRQGRKAGTVTLWYIILYSAGRFSLEFLRADSLMIAGMKAAQLTSLIFIVLAGALLVYWRHKDGDLETQSGA